MKALASLLLIAALAGLSQAQEQPTLQVVQQQPVVVQTPPPPQQQQQQPAVSAPKDVSILKFSCQKARVYAVLDSSRSGGESFEDMRRRVGGEMVVNAARNLPGGKAAVGGTPATTAPSLEVLPRARNGYRYKVALQNTGALEIKAVAWDYIFSDPLTQEIVARHQFVNHIQIKPGKTKELVAYKLSPPTKTVSAAGLERNNKNTHTEQVVLKSIMYADGSIWPRP